VRVCDVNNFYSPRGGGVKTYHEHKIAYFLRHPEHTYTLVYGAERAGIEQLGANVRVVRLPGVRMSPDYHFVFNAFRLRRVLSEAEPDVIEIGEPYFLPWVTRVAALGRGRPILGYWHADFPITYVERPVGRHASPRLGRLCGRVSWWYARRTYGPLAGILVASNAVSARMNEHGLLRTRYAPLGVDTTLFAPEKRDACLRESVGTGRREAPGGQAPKGHGGAAREHSSAACGGETAPERPIILFPHRLTEEKGLSVMLEAFPRIAEATNAVLVLAGTGPGEKLLLSFAEERNDVHYLGYLTDRELLARWYASADLVCALSPTETFGFTAIEALASGCPVVVADQGALPELVEDTGCGVIVPHRRPDLLAEAAIALLTDPPRREEAGKQGRRRAIEDYEWERVFERILGWYACALEEQLTPQSRRRKRFPRPQTASPHLASK
jgi:glycosyltransferase involved in cell wall biosynthesis